jgi:glutamyl-tRNA synthetase
MHIGNARTALFNWLYARKTGGKFLVRIEDTDRERYSTEAVDIILKGLDWLGLQYDNTPVSQFEGRARHAEVAYELLKRGLAYECYCTPEELDAMREQAKAEGKPTYYDRRWRDAAPDAPKPPGIKPVIRIKSPLSGDTTVHDVVQGDVTVKTEQLDDFIILRSDGTPVYMLAVVVDDHDMGVTHVIRGDDHLNNTFRQNVIYDSMGWTKPTYAHLPLIHGADGAKFSKRHGAQSVDEYRLMGFLPEALNNYLMRLGWSHGDDEIITMDQAVEWFDIVDVNKSAARFDFAKLESINAHYMKMMDDSALLALLIPFLKSHLDLDVNDTARARLLSGMKDLKDRAKTLVQLAEESAFYVRTTPLPMTEAALKNLDAAGKETLAALHERLSGLPLWNAENIDAACRTLANDLHGGKLGKVMMPFRAALTGSDKSPALPHVAKVLGKEETLGRLLSITH